MKEFGYCFPTDLEIISLVEVAREGNLPDGIYFTLTLPTDTK
jgi:hypothetical protein